MDLAKSLKFVEPVFSALRTDTCLNQALGLSLDLISRGLGMRSQRFAAVIVDGVVNVLNVEKSGEFNVSTAEAILSAL